LSTGELAFLASDVPPTGGAKYVLAKAAASDAGPVQWTFDAGKNGCLAPAEIQGNRLDNGLVSVEIDPATGAVSSLKAAHGGAELVDRSKHPGLNDYLYVAGRKPDNPQRNGAPTITVKEKGPLVASLLVTSGAPGCASLTREVRLVAGLDHVELVDTLDKTNIYEKEGVHLAFPFNVPDGVVRMDLPFAVARPEADQMAGACKNYFTVQRWVDVSNDALGVTWAVADTPLVQVGGITNDPTVSGWIERLEPSTTLVAYVMNNYWETNYKASQDGPTTFRYALRPHTGYDPAAAQRFGVEFTQPLVAVPAAKRAKAPETRVRIAPDCVVATVLKPGDDGASDILRLFNASDTACEAVVDWGRPRPKRVEMSSLSETPGDPLDGPVRLAPYEVVTLRAVR
ncbi:MAG TPA: glycoside hydrolase family 38 C-terminal domain-containing protein, partial [Candidatus Hydrogenedentes bacterium]|nr:glycoside hydrolase family 38 C-terminal domain-containing protein [Candidatus Hydrogenedentota bacterium]